MEPFNFEYICAEFVRYITVSLNLINLLGAILIIVFVATAIVRKLNWIITILVVLMLLTGIYFVTIDIRYASGCSGSTTIQKELIPSWWHE